MSTVQASASIAMVGQAVAAAQAGPKASSPQGGNTTPVEKVIVSSAPPETAAAKQSAQRADPDKLRERLERVVDDLNSMVRSGNRDLSFGVDHVANRYVMTVKNVNSGDVIRQIPGEDVLRIAHRMEALKGMLFEDLF